MTRNVKQLLRRPHGLAQVQCHHKLNQLLYQRPYASQSAEDGLDNDRPAPKARDYQDDLHLLRVADQNTLRETTRQTSDLIQKIKDLRDHISSIPTTVQTNPRIPAYTISTLRYKTRESIPNAAQYAIERAEHVKAHLRDLQMAEYVDKKDTAMVVFEKEISNWTDEEKAEKLRNWQYEGEATAANLRATSRKLLEDVRAMSNRRKQTAQPEFGGKTVTTTGNSQAAGWKDAKAKDEKQAVDDRPQTVIDLGSLQRRLQAAVGGQGKR